MNPLREKWSVVIRGRWNPAIFTPDWLSANIYDGAEELGLEFPTRAGAPYRYHGRGVRLEPSATGVTLTPDDLLDATLQEMERQAILLIETLPHTPLTAVGTNFTFTDAAAPDAFLALFDIADRTSLADAGYAVDATRVTRKLLFDGRVLNLSFIQENGDISIEFNFHRSVGGAVEAAEALTDTVIPDRDRAIELLDVYHLTVDFTPENAGQ